MAKEGIKLRFLHTADWHIGKKLNGYDLLAEQEYIIDEFIQLALKEEVDAIVIAGDLYDRSVPSVEAVDLFNRKIKELNLTHQLPVLAISGNHDSSGRLAVGSEWFVATDFFLSTDIAQALQPVEFLDTQFYLLPFFEPFAAELHFDETLKSSGQAVARVIEEMQKTFNPAKKQVLVSHFFVAGSLRSDSETQLEVGGLASVPLEILRPFDYVALGHLHNKEAIKDAHVQYSGALLKFSTSEVHQEKGVYLVDTQKGQREFIPLRPKNDLIEIKGLFTELLEPTFYQQINREAFVKVVLEDRQIIPNLMNQLRTVYPKILSVERKQGVATKQEFATYQERKQSPQELARCFFTEMTEQTLTNEQSQWLLAGIQQAKDEVGM